LDIFPPIGIAKKKLNKKIFVCKKKLVCLFKSHINKKPMSSSSSLGQSHLADMTMMSRYSRPFDDGSLESWEEIIQRVFEMHSTQAMATIVSKYQKGQEAVEAFGRIEAELRYAQKLVNEQYVFPSGRTLQFGGIDILKHNARNFNCTAAFASSPSILYKTFYLLLCGCGVGLSIQKHHVAMLPMISPLDQEEKPVIYQVTDSIEGWAMALRVVFAQYFENSEQKDCHLELDESVYYRRKVVFDFSKVRPKGAKISNLLGKAPGPDPLRIALEKVQKMFEIALANDQQRLRPIDVFDIVAHVSDSVLAGGVRRSAMLLLFSASDNEMANSKIGNWWAENPQRARANISALVLRKDLDNPMMTDILDKCKQFGEPGLILADDTEMIVNPCAEITLYPVAKDGAHCFEFCNLSEVNVDKCQTDEEFLAACRAAAIVGTIQACYTDIPFLGTKTREVIEESRLLGVSLTGVMQNVAKGLKPDLLKRGALVVRETNDELSAILGINPAHRLTTIKPSGTASVVLGLSACGAHPSHSSKYIRHVRVSNDDPIGIHYSKNRQRSVNKINANTNVIAFPIDVSANVNLRTKDNMSAIELLESAQLLQMNWVLHGHVAERQPDEFHGNNNVSLTVNIKEDEWKDVGDFIVRNKNAFTGISFLGTSGDVDYEFAPFVSVWSPEKLIAEFGVATLFASGLVVDVKKSFEGSLFNACAAAKFGLPESKDDNGHLEVENQHSKSDSIRRIRKFATTYFGGKLETAINCLKRCDSVYQFERMVADDREHGLVDWTELIVDKALHEETQAQSRAVVSCSGGSCVLTNL
jgi:ribonucleoside-diphosphate reductase alpha chain